ncbi:uncharacterized protein LOC141823610 [Curcuma longa]|uniref:uncharacterized protein LOC141823610 n=1 Tax=Curcuma longa TaxID=136217 RepID=UPI003D9FAB3F
MPRGRGFYVELGWIVSEEHSATRFPIVASNPISSGSWAGFVQASRSETECSLSFQLRDYRNRLLGIIRNTGPAQRAGGVHPEPSIAARDVEDVTAVGQPPEILPFAIRTLAYRALGDLSPAPVCDRLLVLERRHGTDDGGGQASTASLARRLIRPSPVLLRIRNPSSLLSPPRRRDHTSRRKTLLLDDDAASAGQEADGSGGEVVVVLEAGWVTGGGTQYHALLVDYLVLKIRG